MSEESFTDEDDEAHDEDQREVSSGHHELWGCFYHVLGLVASWNDALKHEVLLLAICAASGKGLSCIAALAMGGAWVLAAPLIGVILCLPRWLADTHPP